MVSRYFDIDIICPSSSLDEHIIEMMEELSKRNTARQRAEYTLIQQESRKSPNACTLHDLSKHLKHHKWSLNLIKIMKQRKHHHQL